MRVPVVHAGMSAQKKTRKRAVKAAVDELLEQEFLDEEEQEELIQEFEQIQVKQMRSWRIAFGGIAGALAVFFCYSAWKQAVQPWQVRYTAEFRTVTEALDATIVLLLQGCSLLATAVALFTKLPQKGEQLLGLCMPNSTQVRMFLTIGTLGALMGAGFWGAAMWRMIRKYGYPQGARWEQVWLPLGPLVYCLLCQYVIHNLTSTANAVTQMRALKYTLKKV